MKKKISKKEQKLVDDSFKELIEELKRLNAEGKISKWKAPQSIQKIHSQEQFRINQLQDLSEKLVDIRKKLAQRKDISEQEKKLLLNIVFAHVGETQNQVEDYRLMLKKRKIRKYSLVAAMILFLLVPCIWISTKISSPPDDLVLEKPVLKSSESERKDMPKLHLEPSPQSKPLPVLALNPKVLKADLSPIEDDIVLYQRRDSLTKEVRILENEDKLSIWSKARDTLKFRLLNADLEEVHQQSFTYLRAVVIDKEVFSARKGYYYHIYNADLELIFQSKLGIN